ncbi:MAG TPA: 2-isopropylmalate synthase, partial [Clostridiales bacterium]|nr:2-isopropylmalate synthase [Clostridiales bacterium]
QFNVENSAIKLNKNDDKETVVQMAETLGYELSEEDEDKVYEEFCRVAEKKNVGAKELDAIVASVAMQVPSTYQLKNYLVTSGNIMTAQAQISLDYKGELLQGVCMGDGPIDASIKALELLIGRHFDLDDFQIQSVTEGKEAMGFALVKLRKDGKIYSGNGISTDIIGASIRAYVVAVNKIVYEEENV